MAEQQNEQAREMVTVGCRVPNGLRLHVMRRRQHPNLGVDPAVPGSIFDDLGFIDLPSFADQRIGTPGRPARNESFTQVDKELFDVWMVENKNGPLVKNGVVFVHEPKKPKEHQPDQVAAGEPAAELEQGQQAETHTDDANRVHVEGPFELERDKQ